MLRFVCSIAAVAVYSFTLSPSVFAQRISFGVVTGTALTDDFRNAVRTYGNQPGTIVMRDGIIVQDSLTFAASNASDAFILGPKMEFMLSKTQCVPFIQFLSIVVNPCLLNSLDNPFLIELK